MESSYDTKLTSFQIVYNNQLIELNYDPSFDKYKTIKINSVIQKVLERLGPKPLNTTSENYILICSCGKHFDSNQFISNSKCEHNKYFDASKNKNEKFLLIEKNPKEQNIDNNKNNEFLSNFELTQILMKATGAKKTKQLKVVPENKNPDFTISENLKAKIKELQIKKERGNKLTLNAYEIRYNEQYYQEFLEIGIESNKIKAALRMTGNRKQEALLLATDPSFTVNNDRDYLYCDNSDVLTKYEFFNKCKEEVRKEFPNIFEDDIKAKTKMVIKAVNKKNNGNEESLHSNNSEIWSESSSHEHDSEEDSFILEHEYSIENSSEV